MARRPLARSSVSVLTALAVALALAALPAAPAAAHVQPLTNLAHLAFLGARVTPPAQAGHDTYRLAAEPAVGVLWTYAERQPDGSYRRVGGGGSDPPHNHGGEG